jgi:hypothetical protein
MKLFVKWLQLGTKEPSVSPKEGTNDKNEDEFQQK